MVFHVSQLVGPDYQGKKSRKVPSQRFLAILDECNILFKGWKSLKNLKVGFFRTDFKQVPFVFRQTTHIYSES